MNGGSFGDSHSHLLPSHPAKSPPLHQLTGNHHRNELHTREYPLPSCDSVCEFLYMDAPQRDNRIWISLTMEKTRRSCEEPPSRRW